MVFKKVHIETFSGIRLVVVPYIYLYRQTARAVQSTRRLASLANYTCHKKLTSCITVHCGMHILSTDIHMYVHVSVE